MNRKAERDIETENREMGVGERTSEKKGNRRLLQERERYIYIWRRERSRKGKCRKKKNRNRNRVT